ncbi:hypothetical protein [Pelomicrobium sp.]|jgi:hypothetical protein|uniref:hypothetical protein n=1 Tax=Pelomicrobium sp. TaxID=2815319 RepID=UPI002FDE0390
MSLEEKLKTWYQRPEIRGRNWEPRLFWVPAEDGNPFGRLKVDPWELEVLFATLLGERAEHYEALNARVREGDTHRAMGRADFIATCAKRGELPLLTRIEDAAASAR